jgi:hypothetical protein
MYKQEGIVRKTHFFFLQHLSTKAILKFPYFFVILVVTSMLAKATSFFSVDNHFSYRQYIIFRNLGIGLKEIFQRHNFSRPSFKYQSSNIMKLPTIESEKMRKVGKDKDWISPYYCIVDFKSE